MQLSEFIHANSAAILREWRGCADQPSERAQRVSTEDDERLLMDLAHTLRQREETGSLAQIAAAHLDLQGSEALEAWPMPSRIVRDFSTLRTCILRLWREENPQVSLDEAEQLVAAVDRVIEHSLDHYVNRRSQLLEGLEQIADAAFDVEDLEEFLGRLLHIFTRFAPSIDSVAVLLREGDSLRVRGTIGLEDEERQAFTVRIGDGFSGTIAATRKPLLLGNAWQDPLVRSDSIRHRQTRALYGVPLIEGDEVVGVAHIGTRGAGDIPQAEKRLFAALAQRATSAITKHRLRGEARRRTAELDAVIEAIPSAVFIGDRERVTRANRAALDLVGLSSRDQIETATPAAVHPLDARDPKTRKTFEPEATPYARALHRGETSSVDLLWYHRRSGQDRILRAHAGPIRDGDEVIGAAMVLNDVTEVNAAIDQLQALVDNIPDLTWMATPDGHIEFYNRRWYEYTGTTPEEMQGWGWKKVHHPDLLPEVSRRWEQSLRTGEPFEMEFPLRGDDGKYRWFLTRVRPLRDASGQIVRWFGTNTDIDEQRRLRGDLHNAMEDMKRNAEFRERFIGIVSHDLRNPLNAMSISAGAVLKSPDLPPNLAKSATRILSNLDRMTKMVSDLLDFTRGRLGGGIPIELQSVDLHRVIRRVLDEFDQAHTAGRIDYEVRGNPVGTWDPDRLAQVVSNLVSNALHHGTPGRPVEVTLDGTGEGVVLSVHNEGRPIPSDVLPHIFEPFRRGQASSDSPAGLGLGLYIVFEIVLAHGGDLGVASDAEHGTTFTVELPRNAVLAPGGA